MQHLKRGGGVGGAEPRDAVVLDLVGLGKFARLSLLDPPPDELGLFAAYDDASGRIVVSVCGGAVSASLADLAGALGLPMGPVGLPAGVDAAVFSTAEAIGAVRRFVCDRVLLGWAGSGGAVSMEVAAALQLVEEGKAYEVDWGGLIWAVVKRLVVAGTPWPYAPYLLHLMVCQRPELFAESLPLGKSLKDQVLRQCQLGGEGETSLGFLGSQNMGDLEEMPIFDSQPQEVGGNWSYHTISHSQVIMQQIQGYVSDMNSKCLDKEQACRDTQHEVECLKNMVMEKDEQIEAIIIEIKQELLDRRVVKQTFEADKDQLSRSVQHYHKLIKKSLAQFQEYKETTEMERRIASFNHEVERLKNCRSIPDLNNGVEDDGEGKASWTGEGDLVSNTTQEGQQLVGLIGSPDKRNDTREGMDLYGAQSGTKLCR